MSRKAVQKLVIVLLLSLMGASFFLVKSRIKPFNITSILGDDHPALVKYKRHLELYNDELDVLVMLEKKQGTFYDGDSLFATVATASESFKLVPGLDQISSLYEQVYPVKRSDRMFLETFFKNRHLTEEGRKVLSDHTVFHKTFLEPEGRASIIYLRLRESLTPTERMKVLDHLFALGGLLEAKFTDIDVHFLGTEIARYHFLREVVRSQAIILPIVLSIIMGLLFYLFRSPKVCMLSLLVMSVSYFMTILLILRMDQTINPFSSFALLFVLVISTIDLIHLFSAIGVTEGATFRERTRAAVRRIYKPCLICAVTTWTGLLSLVVAELPPIIHFGIYCAFGVAVCFFLIFHGLPWLLDVFEVELPRREMSFSKSGGVSVQWLTRKSPLIMSAFVAALLILGGLCLRLEAGDNLYRKFVASHSLTVAVEKFNSYFQFTGTIDITIKSPGSYFSSPQGEAMLGELTEKARRLSNVDHVKSLWDHLQLLRRAHQGTKANFETDRNLRAWYNLLEGNGIFESVLPAGADETRMTLFMKSLESEDMLKTMSEAEVLIGELKARGIEAEINGFSTIRATIFHSIYSGFVNSFALDFLAIFICFWIFFRSIGWALLALIPNLLPLVAIGGIMGLFHITVDYNLIVLVAIILGITVDDTTHFIYYLLEKYRSGSEMAPAVEYALKESSVALLGTTFVFCVTLPAFFLTNISMFSQMAFVLILALLLGLGGDMLVLPSMLLWFKRPKVKTVEPITLVRAEN